MSPRMDARQGYTLPYIQGPTYGQHYNNTPQWPSPLSADRAEPADHHPDFGFSPDSSVASSNLSTPNSSLSLSFSPYNSLGYGSMNALAQDQAMTDMQYRAYHPRDPRDALYNGMEEPCNSPSRRLPYPMMDLGSPCKSVPMHSPKPAYVAHPGRLAFEGSEGSVESFHDREDGSSEGPDFATKSRVQGLKRSRLQSEKKRRDDLRDHLRELQDLLPESAAPLKMTKTKVLEHTLRYIVSLQRSQYKLENRCQAYASEVAALKRQLDEVSDTPAP